MIRDRGTIKWTAMMLPEHVKMLREHQNGLSYGKKPVLDEQKYEEFNETICMAMEDSSPLKFTFYQKGEIKQLAGHVHYVDELKKQLRIMDERAEVKLLNMADIIDIDIDISHP
ncbi:YolD-like family protein [Bacillus sp. NEB1478]|uniref:YolD-like family protein n=1 Tax=Bacillus sp. NEB1478 TaxID=3073816 RepID=UPI002873E6EC|nr:YolD-like family protein [Bacillus sp. NEB1478]WNB93632.1 YolD-like family protein [Bacillus sp. NEB1478]